MKGSVKMQRYKPSMFNNYSYASNGDVLLFNSYVGPDSFCRERNNVGNKLIEILQIRINLKTSLQREHLLQACMEL